ncbi:MAG: Gfo/Idh/MocA family oxidoreductase [Candidatus Omnitrophica bacterium]|nr:Gfo/Idh/MocA family oxidoreductase [Candidatus Omnitrophota bacterium]
MKKLRAAVIGCGAIAHHCHIPGYLKNRSVELAALVDPSPKNRRIACDTFGVEKAYKSVEQLFQKEEIDVVSVASPNVFHADHAVAALNHGCHVLCEKPLALSMKEARAIESAAKKAGTIFMVAFSNRLYRGNIKAKQRLDKGAVGNPYMIRIRFAHQGPMSGWAMSNWFYAPDKAGGGALFDMGIHAIDLAAYYFGPIRRVNAMTATLEKKISLEDVAIMQFEFDNGLLGYAESGWTSKQGFAGVEIHGSEAALIVDYVEGAYLLSGETTPSGKRVMRKKMFDKTPLVGGWDVEIDHFIRAVRKGEQPNMDLAAGVQSLKVALAAYESAKKGKTVVIR